MNFKILTVNGHDLSNANHKETCEILNNFSDPITVVLHRFMPGGSMTQAELPAFLEFNSYGLKVDGFTQTEAKSCFCSNAFDSTNETSTFLENQVLCELERLHSLGFRRNPRKCNLQRNKESYDSKEYFHSYYFPKYEKVTLTRPKTGSKFGITLCDIIDDATNVTTVLVTDVARDSEAAASNKIRKGDTLVKVNDQLVSSMDDITAVLNKQMPTITFVVDHRQDKFDYGSYNFCDSKFNASMNSRNVTSQENPSIDEVSRNTTSSIKASKDRNELKNQQHSSSQIGKFKRSLSLFDEKSSNPQYQCGQEQNPKKNVSFSQSGLFRRKSFPHGVTDNLNIPSRSREINCLHEKMDKLNVAEEKVPTTENMFKANESPWVQIARQDYENVLRKLQKESPKLETILDESQYKVASSPPLTDNTSSAYNTGESYRSSSSTNNAKLDEEFLPESGLSRKNKTDIQIVQENCISSDANSDDDEPAGSISNTDDESDSEGFEDARIEFSRFFSTPVKSTVVPPQSQNVADITFYPSTNACDSNKNNCQIEQTGNSSRILRQKPSLDNVTHEHDWFDIVPIENPTTVKSSFPCVMSSPQLSSPVNLANINQVKTANLLKCISDECSNTDFKPTNRLERRRQSELALPIRRPLAAQRSISCVETRELETQDGEEEDEVNKMKWKVRIRRDGTRYITKRPARNKTNRRYSRQNSADQPKEATSDNDFVELKQERSRDKRKRQQRVSRDKKRRREYMRRCRLEALDENTSKENIQDEVSRKKLTRQKRMLLDDFVTVQELLAYGVQTHGAVKSELSVTYI